MNDTDKADPQEETRSAPRPVSPSTETLALAHRSDIDRVHGRLREHDSELTGVKTRLSSVETRMTSVEVSVNKLAVDVHTMMRSVDNNSRQLNHVTELVQETNRTLVHHTNEDAVHQLEQTKATQQLVRMVLAVFAVLGVGTLTVAALYEHLTGESMLHPILGVFGVTF